jgi:hypothetical protein
MKAIFSLFLFGALLSAAPITEQVTLTSVGTPMTDNSGVYVGPYTVSINGGSNVYALCVDDKDISSLNTTWTATVTNVNSGDFSNTFKPASGAEYQEAAYLYNLITQPGADRVNIQHAVWDIMDFSIVDRNSGYAAYNAGKISANDAAIPYIAQAVSNYSSMDLSGFQILTSVGSPRQQEFLVFDPGSATPEPSTYALLGGGLLLVGLSRLMQRKKQTIQTKAVPAGLVRVP